MKAAREILSQMAQASGQEGSNPQTISRSQLTVLSSDAQYAGKQGTPEPVPCEFCGKPRYYMGFTFGDTGLVLWAPYGPEACTCDEGKAMVTAQRAAEQEAQEAERRERENKKIRERIDLIVGESGMGLRFRRRTFATFEINNANAKAVSAARKYADSFDDLLPKEDEPEPGRNGLFIVGPPGTGKTHLAAAIANQLMDQGRPVICMTMIDLLERIKRTFVNSVNDESSVLHIYKTVPLLVLDDIGKEPPTEWAISTVYNIINARYEAYLPTIVTTNYGTDALTARMTPRGTDDSTTATATIGRLIEMCKSIALTGENWRLK